MFDFDFNWDNSLNLNINHLDTQHKELFRIGRDIEQLIFIRCIGVTSEQLMNILYSLRDFITYHFYQEESFMLHINFPYIEDHIKEHNEFKDYITHLNYTALCESPFIELQKLRTVLVDWVLQHISISDKKIALYAQTLTSC